MKIDLASLARQSGIRRKTVILREIKPSQSQARGLYQVYRRVVTIWDDGVRNRILPEYSRTLAALATDSVVDLEAIIIAISEYAATVEISLSSWVTGMVRWHTQRIVSNMRYATNVDLSTIIGTADTAMTVEEFLARNTALIRAVSDQTRGRVSDIVFRNIGLRTPLRQVAKEIAEATGLARKRAMRIAMDQTQKLSASLDRDRQLQLGMEEFDWDHSGKAHPRPEHVARDKKRYRWDSEVGRTDPPGFAAFCGCKARGVLNL